MLQVMQRVLARPLLFGARTHNELPYYGPLQSLPNDFIDINLAFSRTPGANTCIDVCGLKAMEDGVVLALRDVAQRCGLNWESLAATLKREGRLHLETY